MFFLEQNCPLRTESFKLRKNPEYHTGKSLFEDIPSPMVTTFVLDLGQMKKLLKLWLRGSTRIKYRLSGEQ